jgi:uncharacterized membrane protein YecN with MAPEG domain
MTIPIISALVGAVLGIMQVMFMVSAGFHRGKTGINVGTGDDLDLERKVRRHGNLAENAALFIVLLALAEMTVVSDTVVRVLGIIFIVGRIFHAIAFTSLAGSHGQEGSKLFQAARAIGALGTMVGLLGVAGYLLFGML